MDEEKNYGEETVSRLVLKKIKEALDKTKRQWDRFNCVPFLVIIN